MNPNGVNPETGEMADPLATGPALAALVGKVLRACQSMKKIEKAGENTFQRYKYIRLEDVIGEVRRCLLEQGVYFYRSQATVNQYEMREGGDKRIGTFVRMDVEYTLTDGLAELRLPAVAEARGVDDKSLQKAQSSALKYALFQNFLLQHEEDIDEGSGQVDTGPPKQATTTVKAAAPRTVAGMKPAEKPAPVQTAPTPAPQPAAAPGAVSGANRGTIGPEGQALLEHWIEERRKERPDSPNMSAQKLVEWAERDSRAPKGSIKELADIPQAQFSKLAITWGFVKTEEGQWQKRAK